MKPKKIKKWGSRARRHADRAEAAAERAEAALTRISEIAGSDPDERRRSTVYTSPRGEDATPPAAEVT